MTTTAVHSSAVPALRASGGTPGGPVEPFGSVDLVDLASGEDEGTPDLPPTPTPGKQPDVHDEKAVDTSDLRRTDSSTLHLPKVVAPKPLAPVTPKRPATLKGPGGQAGNTSRPKAPKTFPKKRKASLHRKLQPAPEAERAKERAAAKRLQSSRVRVRAGRGAGAQRGKGLQYLAVRMWGVP